MGMTPDDRRDLLEQVARTLGGLQAKERQAVPEYSEPVWADTLEEGIRLLSDAPSGHVQLKFCAEAGLLLRRQVRGFLNLCADRYDLKCEINEHRGLLGSAFMVRAEGDVSDVRRLLLDVHSVTDERR